MSFDELVVEESSDDELQEDEHKQSHDENLDRSKEDATPPKLFGFLVETDDGTMLLHVGSQLYNCDQRESDGVLHLSNFVAIPRSANDNGDTSNDNEEEQPGPKVVECVASISSQHATLLSSLLSATNEDPRRGSTHRWKMTMPEKGSSLAAVMTLMHLIALVALGALMALMNTMMLMMLMNHMTL
ncbi:hypothetical protein MHU86_21838 [Fragilaria crotonensis]|nr:hypothetical protein MHU86_21838 [Fragilaria crotonensis]